MDQDLACVDDTIYHKVRLPIDLNDECLERLKAVMRILYLGPEHESILRFLREYPKTLGDIGDDVDRTEEKLDPESLRAMGYDFIVSYRYRYLVKKPVLDLFPDRVINLHISYLPWNRGADPNLWSFVDNTPKGVTIHYMDEGLDTGDIILQKEVIFDPYREKTLKTTYERLSLAMEQLFYQAWPSIRAGKNDRKEQVGYGSAHRAVDKHAIEHRLTRGYDTLVTELASSALVSEERL